MAKSLNLRRSQRQEKTTARKFGGSVNPGSGNQWMRKNDVRTATESIECKVTEKASYSLKFLELRAAEFNAAVDNRDMRFKITFLDTDTSKSYSYVLMSEDDYLSMRETMNGTEITGGPAGGLAPG